MTRLGGSHNGFLETLNKGDHYELKCHLPHEKGQINEQMVKILCDGCAFQKEYSKCNGCERKEMNPDVSSRLTFSSVKKLHLLPTCIKMHQIAVSCQSVRQIIRCFVCVAVRGEIQLVSQIFIE